MEIPEALVVTGNSWTYIDQRLIALHPHYWLVLLNYSLLMKKQEQTKCKEQQLKQSMQQKKATQQSNEVSNDTSPQIKYLVINIINITLRLTLQCSKTSLQRKD